MTLANVIDRIRSPRLREQLLNITGQVQNLNLITQGTIFYVSKSGNNSDGLSWTNAFTTIAAAITAANTLIDWEGNEEDTYIIIAPGTYAESLTTIPYYCHIIGLGVPSLASSGMSVKIQPASGVAMSGTALGLHLYNLAILAQGAVDILDFDTCNDVVIERCMISPADNSVVNGISTENSDGLNIINCKFKSGLAAYAGMTKAMSFAGGSNKYLHNAVIEGNIIGGIDPTGTGIYVASNCTGTESIIKDNIVMLHGAGVGIDDDSDDVVVMNNVVFHVGGTPYDINAALSKNNYANDNGTATIVPDLAQF